jgi:alkylation response protein AidB-like acyl-CoA dehydrogenase
MNFELSPQHAAERDRAREFTRRLTDRASEFDRSGEVPADVQQEVGAFGEGDLLSLTLVVEEIATASAAAALWVAATGAALDLSGLRGAREIERSPRGQLALAASALGIGKAATETALAALRNTKSGAAEVERPHWVVADVATELDAARLLTYKAAGSGTETDIAMARLMASTAASRAVDAAIRVIGPSALIAGAEIERLARDVRALAVLSGTEEDQRSVAAAGLLPQ